MCFCVVCTPYDLSVVSPLVSLSGIGHSICQWTVANLISGGMGW